MITERCISVVGLGYVGLPLLLAFAKENRVIGFDVNTRRVAELRDGRDRSGITSPEQLATLRDSLSADAACLEEADFHIVAVPTPITATREPDLGRLRIASETLGARLRHGAIVVYESTVYPGATEEECLPMLEQASGLCADRDFHVAYSPERVNPGDSEHNLENTVKVVAARDARTLEQVAALYARVVRAGIHRAPSIRVAEAAKVVENTQRDLNIALMNEVALICRTLELDTGDVLEAAATKWNFLPFSPGLVGGHCIGVDPYYLTHKARLNDYVPRVILAGRGVNDSIGVYVARMVAKRLVLAGERVRGARVTVLGFSFKEDVPDARNTRVAELARELASFGVEVQLHDPLADAEAVHEEYGLRLLERTALRPANAVVLAVPHRVFREAGWVGVSSLLEGGVGVVFDVKSVLPRAELPDGVDLQRL